MSNDQSLGDVRSEMERMVDDPSSLDVHGVDVRGTVFVIPLDAPVPSDISGANVPTGTLYERLAPLSPKEPLKGEFAFVPVSGGELMALSQVWRLLARAPKISVLFALPAARYDIMFTQGVKSIGLKRVEWPEISEQLATRVRAEQRVKDAEPYAVREEHQTRLRTRPGFAQTELVPPTDGDEA